MSAPAAFTWSGYMAFTVPAVPTGMKAGVRTTPRGIRISPVRAAPSVFATVKVKVSVIRASAGVAPCHQRVMPGLGPGIHDFSRSAKAWMAGPRPAMTGLHQASPLNSKLASPYE